MVNKLSYEACVTEEEIRAWMDDEIVRLGDWFNGFEISWHRTGYFYIGQLFLWSESKYDCGKVSHPYGSGLLIGEARDVFGSYLPIIQSEGRKLYYKLKKDYSVRRDLSAK